HPCHHSAPARHRPHQTHLPPQRHRPPPDRRAWRGDSGNPGVKNRHINEADFAKALNVLGHIEEMKVITQARNWDGLERQSELRCQEYAGEADSHRISGISFRPYQESLTAGLSAAVAKATSLGARAIYFEFDTNYEWRSSFF